MGLFNLLTTSQANQFEHHVLVRTSQNEPFTNDFQNAGIPVLSCDHYRTPWRYALQLRKLTRTYGPYDILHVHGSSFSGLLTLLLAKWCGIRWTIVHSHNDVRPTLGEFNFLRRTYIQFVLTAYRSLADSGFAASHRAAESMFGSNWEADPRWELLYYGIDCRPFRSPLDPSLRTKLGISKTALVIGHVGRFHEQKNHAFLLDLMEATVAIRLDTVCLLIGDGPLRDSFTKEVKRRGLGAHFVFISDTLSVPAFMKSAMDCFVFPSRYEGLGLVVVEAQAAGLPCVISDRVPSEAIVNSSLISVLPLDASPKEWTVETLRMASSNSAPSRDGAVRHIETSRFNLDLCAANLWGKYQHFSNTQRAQPC